MSQKKQLKIIDPNTGEDVQPQYKVLKQDTKDGLSALIQDLLDSSKREEALIELSKRRDQFPNLAPILWYSTGVMTALIQEIVSVYSLLSPPTLSALASNRVCNALALLQSIASHNDTRQLFLSGKFLKFFNFF